MTEYIGGNGNVIESFRHGHECDCSDCVMIVSVSRENAQRIMKDITRWHTEGSPFCDDPECPCHEDKENINLLNDLIEQGLLTKAEAALILRGATI